MADASEDTPGRAPGGGAEQGAEEEDDDEVRDFRLLAAFATSNQALPRRGDKDFEPHGSGAQQDALAGARQAMHAALAQDRAHQPRGHLMGVLHESTGTVTVAKPHGLHFRTMGRADRFGTVSLLPEEALYLLERGSLDVRWPGPDGAAEADAVPLSLQAGYALLVDRQGLTLDRYLVYAALRRCGYIVVRAPGWDGVGQCEDLPPIPRDETGPRGAEQHVWSFLSYAMSKLSMSDQGAPAQGPLVKPGLYRNYQDIYRRLALVPAHDPRTPSAASSPALVQPPPQEYAPASPSPRVLYHVYKPASSTFAKSRPGPPDFYLAVMSAREADALDMAALATLLGDTPLPARPAQTNLYARLKTGWRSVVVAVVDAGVISYVRFADAAFGQEPLYHAFGSKPVGNKGRPRRAQARRR